MRLLTLAIILVVTCVSGSIQGTQSSGVLDVLHKLDKAGSLLLLQM